MDWQLISDKHGRYFKFVWQDNIALYTTKQGQQNILESLNPVLLKQIHSDTIIDIDSDRTKIGDGLLSRKRKCLGIKVADCLPVYLFSQDKACIIHCGWRGIVKGIAKNAKRMMRDFHYVLGPSIGPCCYRVQKDVASLYAKNYEGSIITRDKQYFLDLKAAVRQDLGDETLIGSLDLCTKCHPEYFYSNRSGDKARNYGLAQYSSD